MGCGSSMDTSSVQEDTSNELMHWQQAGVDPNTVVQEFVRLDEKISKLEGTCPGSRLATVEAWVEHLQAKRDSLLGVEHGTVLPFTIQQQQQQAQSEVLTLNHVDAPPTPGAGVGAQSVTLAQQQQNGYLQNGNGAGGGGGIVANGMGVARHQSNNIAANTPTQDLANLALNLGVIGNAHLASTHEDFFANLSESALYLLTIRYYTEILEHTKLRLKTLTESYKELNDLYLNHDSIIAFISGGTYMSRLEERLDSQLETARDIRDKLGSALEQWRICGMLLRASANSATQMWQQWKMLKELIDPREKIQQALECRSSLQASLISLECAQLSLPHVELKYVSNRQILAVKHCNNYMITDIANLSRYEHTTKVFATFESNISKASVWLQETFNKTLRKDYDKEQETVSNLAKTLRDHREEIFSSARK